MVTDPVFEPHNYRPRPTSVYGPILSGFEVEHALAQTVRVWMRDYLAEIERRRLLEVGKLPAFRSMVESSTLSKFPEDQLPALLIASSGVEPRGGRIEHNSDGLYTARFRVECGTVISARGNRLAVKLARYYTAALRTLLIQQLPRPRWSGLEGIRRVEWVGERYAQLGDISERTQAGGMAAVIVEVEGVSQWGQGPLEPSDPPIPGDWPVAERVEVTVIKEELSHAASRD